MYSLLKVLSGLGQLLQFVAHFIAGVVVVLEKLVAEHLKCLEGTSAGINLHAMFLQSHQRLNQRRALSEKKETENSII